MSIEPIKITSTSTETERANQAEEEIRYLRAHLYRIFQGECVCPYEGQSPECAACIAEDALVVEGGSEFVTGEDYQSARQFPGGDHFRRSDG